MIAGRDDLAAIRAGINPGACSRLPGPAGGQPGGAGAPNAPGPGRPLRRPTRPRLMRHLHGPGALVWRPRGLLWREKQDGFDPGGGTPWYMVPAGDTRDIKLVGRDLRPYLLSDNAGRPAKLSLGSLGFNGYRLTGSGAGRARLLALDEGQDCHGELEIAVKARKTYHVSFHFLKEIDSRAMELSRSRRPKAGIKRLLDQVNDIYAPQANVTFVQVPDSEPNDVVEIQVSPAGDESLIENHLHKFCVLNRFGSMDPRALVVVLFVREITGNARGVTWGNVCCVEDEAGGHALAHEIGHALTWGRESELGYDATGHSPNPDDLMYDYDREDTHPSSFRSRLRRREADFLNDSDR
jgi:hypothetical protein